MNTQPFPHETCAIPGCGRPTSLASGKGRAPLHCRYHQQFKNRHGSHWHPTLRAGDLKPYVTASAAWLKANRESLPVRAALQDLEYVLAFSGDVVPANNLRGVNTSQRARLAFARLREADIRGLRLLAIYLGVSALIEDDWGSVRSREFRTVQAAKAVHRLASGTHKEWETWNPLGPPRKVVMHAYPRSAGLVLRGIGETLEKACAPVSKEALAEIIALKTKRFGPHSSHNPGNTLSSAKRQSGA